MTPKHMPRRDFLTSMLAGISVVALNWEMLSRGEERRRFEGGRRNL